MYFLSNMKETRKETSVALGQLVGADLTFNSPAYDIRRRELPGYVEAYIAQEEKVNDFIVATMKFDELYRRDLERRGYNSKEYAIDELFVGCELPEEERSSINVTKIIYDMERPIKEFVELNRRNMK